MKNIILNFLKSILGTVLFLAMLFVGIYSTKEDQDYIDKKNQLSIEKNT